MYRIAIVEDQQADAKRLMALLDQYAKAKQQNFQSVWFSNASEFLDSYRHQYELVFMDIHMPGVDGMSAAHELRAADHTVVLVFLTSLAQYAVESYEVEATDYILKPISAPALELKLPRILNKCAVDTGEVVIQCDGAVIKLKPGELHFVEIYNHHIQFSTANGPLHSYGTLKEIEQALPEGFFRINNQTIVNLRSVTRVDGDNVLVAGRSFPVTRGRRKEFLAALHISVMKR